MVPLFLLMLVVASNAATIADRQGKYFYPLDVHGNVLYIDMKFNLHSQILPQTFYIQNVRLTTAVTSKNMKMNGGRI